MPSAMRRRPWHYFEDVIQPVEYESPDIYRLKQPRYFGHHSFSILLFSHDIHPAVPQSAGHRCAIFSSMIPRCRAMVTACARSLAPSLESMFEMWFLTVVSPIESLSAICLLALPSPIKRTTSISRELS